MMKYLPFLVVGIVAVPLTLYQWSLMDWMWGENIPAMQCAYLLHQEIPEKIGDWVGVDKPVSKMVLDKAGADGYIDRVYTNQKTGESVSIWLIVGHFRNVVRHTPNICYHSNGFSQVEPQVQYQMAIKGLPDSKFHTSKFMLDDQGVQHYQRVFWAWWRPDPLEEGESVSDVRVQWSAPEQPRPAFGYCRALYKLYFTAMSTEEELANDSICNKFAAEFLPVVYEKLASSGVVMVGEELPPGVADYLKEQRVKSTKAAEDETTADPPEDDA